MRSASSPCTTWPPASGSTRCAFRASAAPAGPGGWALPAASPVLARATLAGTLAALEAELGRAPAALLSVTGASNVTGECLPLPEIASLAHRSEEHTSEL